jgi:hypothetical protein
VRTRLTTAKELRHSLVHRPTALPKFVLPFSDQLVTCLFGQFGGRLAAIRGGSVKS